MKKSRFLLSVAAGVSVVVLTAAGVAAYSSVKTLSDASDERVRSKEISLALEQTLGALRDAETGHRGYLLTGRPEYLAPYTAAVTSVDRRLANLRSLSVPETIAQPRFAELEQLARRRMEVLARGIALKDAGQGEAALDAVLTDEGKIIMDRIREVTGGMQLQEAVRYQQHLEQERSARTVSRWSSWAVSVLAIGLLGLLGFIVRRDTAKVRASEEQLTITLRSIGDAVIATDAAGLVTLMNPVAELLTGWSAPKARGQSLDVVFRIINEDTRDTVESPVAKVLREGGVVGLANHTLLIRLDGTELPIEDSGAPILDKDGRIIGVVLVFRDASREREAERDLREADRRKDEFLATLAHELRNPLAPLRQAAKIARAPTATASQVEWAHGVIERQGNNMARLLDDLLDVSRITRGTLQMRKERVELQTIIDAALEIARPAVEARHHTLTVDYPRQAMLCVDPMRLAQVIANLLTNAAKYTPPKGQIRIAAHIEGDELNLQVSDTGIGLSADMIPRLFEMFVQVETILDKSEGGLGIGLALAKGLVELHGGSITAHSAGLGSGSTFTVQLPIEQSTSAKSADNASGTAVTQGPGRRVLIADDNVDSAESLAVLLRLQGHQVEVVHDGAAALRRLEESRPQFALLDIGMPNLNGYEVARRTRAQPWSASITLIALTGWGQEQDRRDALEAGFDHHLLKPVDTDRLAQTLVA